MSSVVADTHTFVWYILEPEKLSLSALAAMEEATTTGTPIYLSAISIVEICYLVEKGRLPEVVLERLIDDLYDADGSVSVMPVDVSIGLAIRRISRNVVPDMPDRIIAATALYLDLPLITRDKRIQAAGIKIIW